MKLSPAQSRALSKLSSEWRSAYEMQESLNTLHALVQGGKALVKYETGSMAFPRICIMFRLREGASDAWVY